MLCVGGILAAFSCIRLRVDFADWRPSSWIIKVLMLFSFCFESCLHYPIAAAHPTTPLYCTTLLFSHPFVKATRILSIHCALFKKNYRDLSMFSIYSPLIHVCHADVLLHIIWCSTTLIKYTFQR